MDPIETAVQGVINNNYEMFEVIIDHFQQKLFTYSYHMLGNIHDAEDAVQEAFIKAFQKIGSYNQAVPFSAWLYRITYNHCINVLRRKKLLQFLPFLDETCLSEHSVEDTYEDNEFNEILQKALIKLGSQDRSVLILRTVDQKNYDEIGMILNIRPATVRKKYERAKKKVRKFLLQEKGGTVDEKITANR